MRAIIRNMMTGKLIKAHSTTDHPDSSYGIPVWVDDEGNSYGQIPYGVAFGFELLLTYDDDADPEPDLKDFEG